MNEFNKYMCIYMCDVFKTDKILYIHICRKQIMMQKLNPQKMLRLNIFKYLLTHTYIIFTYVYIEIQYLS